MEGGLCIVHGESVPWLWGGFEGLFGWSVGTRLHGVIILFMEQIPLHRGAIIDNSMNDVKFGANVKYQMFSGISLELVGPWI